MTLFTRKILTLFTTDVRTTTCREGGTLPIKDDNREGGVWSDRSVGISIDQHLPSSSITILGASGLGSSLGFSGALGCSLGFSGALGSSLGFSGALGSSLGFSGALGSSLGFSGALGSSLGFSGALGSSLGFSGALGVSTNVV